MLYETYAKSINIEAQTMLHMAGKHYIPTIIGYVGSLATALNEVRTACPEADTSAQEELLKQCSDLLAKAKAAQTRLQQVTAQVNALEGAKEMANAFHDQVAPAMKALRGYVDELELCVDKDLWPVPTYGDLMFEV